MPAHAADSYPHPVRLNRYLAAAGSGTRRTVEGLVRMGRVTVNGVVADSPGVLVGPADEVLVSGRPLSVDPRVGVVLHRPPGGSLDVVHPADLVPVLPLPAASGGLELLLVDDRLARRVADPAFPRPERWSEGRRVGLAGILLGPLEEGAWRPLAPRELEGLRRSVRLPPRQDDAGRLRRSQGGNDAAGHRPADGDRPRGGG